nr:IPT/TIG domain-containing protein [Candidatus Sigynarchaeota archaeon]
MVELPELHLRNTSLKIAEHLLDRYKLGRFLELHTLPTTGPAIIDFQPVQGYAGTLIVIGGSGFSIERNNNYVEVGGRPARVIAAEPNRLIVITHHQTRTGPVKVTVDGKTTSGSRDFSIIPWPKPDTSLDGPPYSYEGIGTGNAPSMGTVPSKGTARILVVVCNPTDLVPPNPANTRQNVVDSFAVVTKFYDQASYGQLSVQVDVTSFVVLLNNADYYHRANGAVGYPNIDAAVLDQLMAECAQGAVNQSFDLNNYSVMVASIYLPGLSVRAWGGWSQSNFAYTDGAGVSINITTNNPLGLVAQRHDADWGRAAHEFGHNLVDGGLELGEDVYSSDLIDPTEATVQNFDMMGNHDSHPLFSAFYMHQLGWYNAANIKDLIWDRNSFSQEFDIIAHDLNQNTNASLYHLIRIKVSDGLYYFVEVRQRPDTSAAAPQIFDENITLPLGGTPVGGVLVTKVITGELNNNHQTRLITLLQEQTRVMVTGDEAVDPLRTFRLVVVNDSVQARPRICRVRIEWAQVIADTPGGNFDLRIEPWGPGWETPDIWIDRNPFGTYDNTDAAGNPVGNGDAPRPLEINHFEARIRNDGSVTAKNVKVTHYAVEPPGVGDNGNWAPLATYTIASIPANNSVIRQVNWVPLIGEHSCLKVAISPQLGEVTTGNNSAQENVFTFQPAADSVPEPVVMTVAVRNPLKDRSLVMISLQNIPSGYYAYFPHRWLWLDGLAERKLDLLIIPLVDIHKMKQLRADVRLFGRVPHAYSQKLDMTGYPSSWFAPIGGILASITPKHRSKVNLDDKVQLEKEKVARIFGIVTPHIKGQELRIDMVQPDDSVFTTQVKTDDRGRFSVVFDLAQKDRKTGLTLHKGMIYSFQAHILNATLLAPSDSNIVLLKLGDRDEEPSPPMPADKTKDTYPKGLHHP